MYIIHRDNPAVPVGEFVDVLNRSAETEKDASYSAGVQLDDATRGPRRPTITRRSKNGLQGFLGGVEQFFKARMVDAAVERDAFLHRIQELRAWFTKTQTPLLCVVAVRARGFFIPTQVRRRSGRIDKELVRCWYRGGQLPPAGTRE